MDETPVPNDPFSARLSRLATMFRPDTTTHAIVAQWFRDNHEAAAELRAIAEEMAPAAVVPHIDSWTVLDWSERLAAIAARLEE